MKKEGDEKNEDQTSWCLGLGRAEGKHVDECAGEFRPSDQRVTLQKKSTAGI